MQRTNIYLDEDQLLALKRIAAQQGRSVAAVVREAVNRYLATTLSNDDWRQEWDRIVQRFRDDVPPALSSEETEAVVETAIAEVRLRRSLERLETQEEWDRSWDAITERFRERVRPYLSAESIEAEVELAGAEVRAAALRPDH